MVPTLSTSWCKHATSCISSYESRRNGTKHHTRGATFRNSVMLSTTGVSDMAEVVVVEATTGDNSDANLQAHVLHRDMCCACTMPPYRLPTPAWQSISASDIQASQNLLWPLWIQSHRKLCFHPTKDAIPTSIVWPRQIMLQPTTHDTCMHCKPVPAVCLA